MVFRKEKMIERLTREGRGNEITMGTMLYMDNLDGQPAGIDSYNRLANGTRIYSCFGKDGQYFEVAETDCE